MLLEPHMDGLSYDPNRDRGEVPLQLVNRVPDAALDQIQVVLGEVFGAELDVAALADRELRFMQQVGPPD